MPLRARAARRQVTFGGAVDATAAGEAGVKGTEETVEIAVKGGKIVRWISKAGSQTSKLMGKAVAALQTINPKGLAAGTSVTRRIFFAKLGTAKSAVLTGQ